MIRPIWGLVVVLAVAGCDMFEPDKDLKITLTGESVRFKDRQTDVFRRGDGSQRFIRVNFRDEPCVPNNQLGCQLLADRLSAELPDEFQGGEGEGHSH